MLAPCQFGLYGAVLIDENTAQSIASRSALTKTKFNQSALTGEYLGGQFPAILASHSPFDAFDDRGYRGTVILKLLGAVGDLNAGTPAPVLVIRTFVGILEATPPTDVVDQDDREVRRAAFDVLDQLL